MANFLSQFISNPLEVGSPFRCSKEVGAKMARAGQVENAKVVVEFGPGTGVITKEIQKQLSPGTTFFAIEINPKLAAATRKKTGATVYVDSCQHVKKYLEENGQTHCDSIICTIPWAVLKEKDQEAIMDEVMDVLLPGGLFVTVGLYHGRKSPGGRRLKKMLESRFSQVEQSKSIWSNIPPAFYYTCVK